MWFGDWYGDDWYGPWFGGDRTSGSVQAQLSGSSSVTATLTGVESASSGDGIRFVRDAKVIQKRRRRKENELIGAGLI